MKKSTQKTLMALGIIFIFAMSSIAFVFSGFGGQTQQSQQLKPLESFVVDGDIDPQLENAYIQGGFTFFKFYYNSSVGHNLMQFIEQVPASFTTSTGQQQLIVLKIQSPTNYARIININGETDLNDNELTIDSIYVALCSTLIAPPPECVVGMLNTTG